MTERGLTRKERDVICDAFAASLPYEHCRNAGEILWRDASKRPNNFRPVLYQHRHMKTHRWCPRFTRLEVNFADPWRYRRKFWERHESLDSSAPNYGIEITVLPEEAVPLASWLPQWLVLREGLPVETLPDPPKGMVKLLLWQPRHMHVYFWSEAADSAYEQWLAEQKGVPACR